jgi:hypothetical protein
MGNFLIFDDSVSLEAFENLTGECAIKMYYNESKQMYIIANFTKDDIMSLISELQTISERM